MNFLSLRVDCPWFAVGCSSDFAPPGLETTGVPPAPIGQVLDLEVTQARMTVSSRVMTALPVTIAYRGHTRAISPGQSFSFNLVPEVKPDRGAREREQERACKGRPTEEKKDELA